MGPGRHDDKEARVLSRIVRWTSEGVEYEADPRQAEKLLRDLQMDAGVKSVGSPGVKATRDQFEADAPLPADKTSPFRAVVARCNYLAAGRPDCQFASKEVCRWIRLRLTEPLWPDAIILRQIALIATLHLRKSAGGCPLRRSLV